MNMRLVIWVLAALVTLEACDTESPTLKKVQDEKVRQERLAQQENAKRDELMGALKKAYDADDSWGKGLGINNTWTVDLQDRLIGKPIVSFGFLVDVWRDQDNKHYLHLLNGSSVGVHYDFVLSCSKPQKLPESARTFPEYFFVAKVQSVRKDARYTNNQLMTGYTGETPSFTIRGECLEVRINEERLRRDLQENPQVHIDKLRGLLKKKE
jgi:hypothetical protein